MGSDDHSQIVKGNRPKRQRSSSPFGFTATDSSGDDCYNNSISFPTTSGEIYESTEEEEEEADMANCLIMLAQGDHKVQKLNTVTCNNNNNKAAAGFYVYECKTCNRSFASFQALGGHRASHKKILEAAEKRSSVAGAAVVTIKDDFNSDSPLHQKGSKIHECSICGSEFTSGQALGGHMRRHRGAGAAANKVTVIKPDSVTRSVLPLDLNLPAPEDDHHIGFGTTQFQSVVLSSPALVVDCHY